MSGITHEELLASFKEGLRNGNWRHLNPLDKALYRASLWYAKHRGSIVNVALAEKLLGLVEKLRETKGMRILKELENLDFDDAYSMTKSEQEKVFINIVQIYSKALGAIR